MADSSKPVEKVKNLDGSISKTVSNNPSTDSTTQDALPLRQKDSKDVPPPGQTLTGKQEHCMC